jgi:cardiolipin synthase
MSMAAKRGVKIRIILTKISDIILAKQAERFFYPWLLRRNIEIYEYRQEVLHGKISTYDNHWVTVGSYNFNTLSAYGSIELNLDIHNPAFANEVDQALETIIQHDCELITQETVSRKTNIWTMLVQRFAYEVFRFLYFIFFFNFKQRKA